MIQMSSQSYRPQQQHQKRNQRHHHHHHHNHHNQQQQQQQTQQQQQQPHQQQQQQNDNNIYFANGNVSRFFSTERNNGPRYINSNGNGNANSNINVAATDGHLNNHNHNASVFEPIRIPIHKDVKNKYSNNKSSAQVNNKKSVSPSPSVASSGSSTTSGTNKNSNKNHHNNSNSSNNSSNSNNNNNNSNNNRNSKSYNGNTMQPMNNTHRINVNNTNKTNIPTTPTNNNNIQQIRFTNRLRYMDPSKSHQFVEQNARPSNLLGTIDGFNLYPSLIKPNFLSSIPQQKIGSGLSGNPVAVNGRKFYYDSTKFRELKYRSRMNEITMPIDLYNNTEWDSLSQKIWAKFEQKRQSRDIFEKKMHLWNNLRKVVEMLFGGSKCLYMVGSTISGMALDTSDVDMCIVSRTSSTLEERTEAFAILNELRIYLQKNCQTFSQNLNYIPAKVPILRFDHPENGVEVDLNYNNCVGIRNSHLLYCYTLLDWRLQPLAVMVKLWAQHHDINNAKDLTISSYSLILMVIHYLQCGVQPAILPCLHAKYPEQFEKILDINNIEIMDVGVFLKPADSQNKQTLGELFVGFLEYYSNFKFERYAISVRAGRLLPIEECRNFKNEADWRQLCIEEPFDRSNAARSCCDERIFERIKKIFIKSWHLLQDTKDLDRLFSDEIFEPPAIVYYDSNYSRILYHHPMDYIVR